jgi:hypothetical protein
MPHQPLRLQETGQGPPQQGAELDRSTLHVPLLIERTAPALAPEPITVGFPFPRGALRDTESLVLLDSEGRAIPLQTTPLARWTDSSVKWLLTDFILDPCIPRSSTWQLLQASATAERPCAESLRVQEANGVIEVATGQLRFRWLQVALSFFPQAVLEGQDFLDRAATRLRLRDAHGRVGRTKVQGVVLETTGPLRTTVRIQGVFAGRGRCRFVARFCFFAGTGLVRLRLTVHNPNRAHHPGGLWDLGDPGSIFFQDLSLELGLAGAEAPGLRWSAEPEHEHESAGAGPLEIYQDSSGGEQWQSKNHVNRFGQVPCTFRGYRVRHGGNEVLGLRANPVVSLQLDRRTLTAALPEFWQQFPKALEAEGRLLRVRLFPQQFNDLFELQGGEQKTHTLWLHFGGESQLATAVLSWVHQPARVHASPSWYADSGAIPCLVPAATEPGDRLETLLAEVVEGPQSFSARREVIDEYGWRNYGDVYADHEAAYYIGPPPVISHYNNQYDVIHGTLLQYFRTGKTGWFDLGDALARHVIDIDIYHTDQDRAAYNGGFFWLTDHYKDAATCTHRTYSRAHRPPWGASYGGGPASAHNFTTGLLHYYYLVGDPAAREAVLGLADWVVRMDDGGQNLLGILDDAPTGLASFTVSLDYHGPGRGCANSVNTLLDAWLLSERRAYLENAERFLRRSIHPADDLASRDLLNVEKRWSYTMFLSVVARYLGLKGEAGDLDATYAYARASLLHYARWMLAHEQPYFDHPENLEFPTETWAAQEFRKANVLRLAAAHAEEPLRARLLARGEELAQRAWYDLLRFESRTVARAIAILLVEGTRDAFLRSAEPERAPASFTEYDFGEPETFVPQRQRIRTQLKTAHGLWRALTLLADPRCWRRLSTAVYPR